MYPNPQLCSQNQIFSYNRENINLQMAESIKFNLPKVCFRTKTSPSDHSLQQKTNFQLKQYRPCNNSFKQRQRMKKQIQDSYIKFRKLRKNNYQKHFSSFKKQAPVMSQEKRLSTLNTQQHHKEKQIYFDFSLETQDRTTKLRQFLNSKHLKEQTQVQKLLNRSNHSPKRQSKMSKRQKQKNKNHYFSIKQSISNSPVEDPQIQLQGVKCNYINFKDLKGKNSDIKKYIRIKQSQKERVGSRNSFMIDPWRDGSSQLNTFQQSF